MIRFLFGAIAVLLLLRIFFRVARALSRSSSESRSAGHDPGDTNGSDIGAGMGGRPAKGKARVRAATERERSTAIEVPFTEVPPEEPARRP